MHHLDTPPIHCLNQPVSLNEFFILTKTFLELDCIKSSTYLLTLLYWNLQNIYTPIVHDKKEQNYSTSIISLENSESSLPASKSQSNPESDSSN
jgi:hypothetical protein